jgi:SpoVK/Ycf46/Vps4 family AAA+-type ATPase
MVGVEDRVVATMLTATDGFTKSGNVLFILTTNRVDRIDEALRRSLRAETIRFERPDAPRTRALFRLYLRDAATVDATPDALADLATRAIFAAREPLAVATLKDGARLPLTRAMAVSGALVRAACERAGRRAFVRRVRANGDGDGARGLRADDLRAAIDEEMAGVTGTLTLGNLTRVLTIPTDQAERIVALAPNTNAARRYVDAR